MFVWVRKLTLWKQKFGHSVSSPSYYCAKTHAYKHIVIDIGAPKTDKENKLLHLDETLQ